MRLMIDGVEVPLSTTKVKLPAYDLQRIRGCEAQREGDTLKLAVKVTPSTSVLFGFANQAYPGVSFNDDYHHGELIVDGVVLFSGVVAYHSTEYCNGESVYNVELRSGGATWADKAATTKLNESDIAVEHRMNLASIAESWGEDSPIRYLPLHRDGYTDVANTGLYEVYYPLLPQDYHPFISVKALINSVIDGEGYNLRSKFMGSQLFNKLMFSGAYRSIVSEEAYATMDFKAVRSTSTTATADTLGRVDAWVPLSSRNIGAFVDTVTPTTLDENGKPCADAFSVGGCFSFDDGRPMFSPRREISVAFDLHFDYTTEYRIKNSKWLQGFTDIYVGNGCYVDVALPNPHADNRKSVIAGILYKLYIFDYDASASYRITDIGVVCRVNELYQTMMNVSPIDIDSDMYRGTRSGAIMGSIDRRENYDVLKAYFEFYGEREERIEENNMENRIITCCGCNNEVDTDDVFRVENGNGEILYFCEDCYNDAIQEGDVFVCEYCNNSYTNDVPNTYMDDTGYRYCCNCLDRGRIDYVECYNCGNVVEHYVYDDYDDVCYCNDCYEARPQGIHGYHNHCGVSLEFLGSDSDQYFGLEIEVDSECHSWDALNRYANEVRDIMGDLLYDIQEDGSLSRGFEIITRPMTYEYFTKYGRSTIEKALNYLRNNDFLEKPKSSGIHIHMSKKPIADKNPNWDDDILYLFETFREDLQ